MYRILLTLPGPLISGFIVYFILSSLAVPFRIIFPISVIISALIFGLAKYYSNESVSEQTQYRNTTRETIQNNRKSVSNVFFVCAYFIIIVVAFLSEQSSETFIHWEYATGAQIISLVAAIILSIFAPGYALVTVLDRKHELASLPRFLVAYLLSIFLAGLIGYVTASIGLAVSSVNTLVVLIHLVILAQFVCVKILLDKDFVIPFNIAKVGKALGPIKKNFSEVLVFASLFSLVILSTYYLNNGVLIGDQWYHYGKSQLFLSGKYRDLALSEIEQPPYPPFQHAFLATFFGLSSLPAINAYVALNFLNIMPVFAFYYFFTIWLPDHRKTALLASTLFMLSSGFGWAYLINLTANNPVASPMSALNVISTAAIKTFDITIPNTFVDAGHPDITTGLIIIALPAGFVLLGLIKQNVSSKLKNIALIIPIVILGYLTHDEFGFFLIVGSVILVIFRLNGKNTVFAAMVIALSFLILIDFLSPAKYYKVREFFGIPLVVLYFLFVNSMWALNASNFLRRLKNIFCQSTSLKILRRIIGTRQVRLVLGIGVVSVVSYLYIISFVVWYFQLPTFDIRVNTDGFKIVPWYLYPLRFGITGFVGLCFILSYLFRKFESEVFIFGIMAIIAFFTLLQHEEIRANKYIMVCMASFASLLLFRILSIPRHSIKRPIINGMVLGFFITLSSLSIMMFVGYSALGLETHSSLFEDMLPRRYFPSDSEMDLLNFLRTNININADDNVAIPENETRVYKGFTSKLEGFVGLPLAKIFQSPLTLKESTIEGFYKLLDYSNTRFIVLTRQFASSDNMTDILRFALQNFKKAYEDHKYIVLSVPPLAPPSAEGGDMALIYPSNLDHFDTPLSSSTSMYYNKSFFDLDSSQSSKVNEMAASLKGNETIWSNTIPLNNTNYIESTFRVTDGYRNNQNHSGIVWNDGNNKEYYAFLRPDVISIYTPQEGEFKSAPLIENRENGKWFTLKVVYVNGEINVFLNNTLKLQIPNPSTDFDISKVGIRSFNTVAEFKPLKVGVTSTLNAKSASFGSQYRYNYYYSVSSLALSKLRYDIFAEGDFSAFSKKNVILTSEPVNVDSYLGFAKSGGNVIVFSTDSLTGRFSDLMCLKPYGQTRFDGIAGSSGHHMKILGATREIEIHCSGSTIKSFYLNNGHKVAPFAIEKRYGSGKIIFVNISGYFKSLLNHPDEFLLIGGIVDLIGLPPEKFTKVIRMNSAPIPYFTGNLNMYGKVTINSSSLLLYRNNGMYVQNVSTTGQKSTSNFFYQSPLTQTDFSNTQIRDLKIHGAYDVIINSIGLVYVPLSGLPSNYIQLDLPTGSNMTIKLLKGSKAEFFVGEDDNPQPIRVSYGKIEFKKMRGTMLPSDTTTPIPVLMKTPKVTTNNQTSFQAVRSHYPDNPTKPWADLWPFEVMGKTSVEFDHTISDPNNVKRYVTYFKWIQVDTDSNKPRQPHGKLLEIPWQTIINSSINNKVMVSILAIAIVSTYVSWTTSKLNNSQTKVTTRTGIKARPIFKWPVLVLLFSWQYWILPGLLLKYPWQYLKSFYNLMKSILRFF
jgi:hypothetical protein